MNNDNDELVSLTIKGIRKEAKENFSMMCEVMNKNMNEVLRDFINSTYNFSSKEQLCMKLKILCNLIENNPKLIDEFILEQEPMYNYFSESQKESSRNVYVSLNPSYYYKKYIEWLEKDNNN